MPWSRSTQLALSILPKVSSFLSLVGSLWIAVEVLTDPRGLTPKRRHPYHRLLLAMSIYNILESCFHFASTWPIPRTTKDIWDTRGNTKTCSTQGFFLTLAVAVPIYNAMLSLYFYLKINHGIPDSVLRERAEPAMHAVVFLWAFGTAIAALLLDLFNNATLWCWIAPYPSDCLDSWRYGKEGNCQRGDNAFMYQWAFYFAPLWICILFATLLTLLTYFKVRRSDKKLTVSRKHMNLRPSGQRISNAERIKSYTKFQKKYRSHRGRHSGRARRDPGGVVDATRGYHRDEDLSNSSNEGGQEKLFDGLDQIEECDDESEEELGGPGSLYSEKSRPSLSDVIAESYREWKEKRRSDRENNARSTEFFYQSLWYLGTFYVTHIWSTVNRMMLFTRGYHPNCGVFVLHALFDPLQGFLNFLVYQRSRYTRIRYHFPNLTRFEAVQRIIQFSFLQSSNLHSTSGGSLTRHQHTVDDVPKNRGPTRLVKERLTESSGRKQRASHKKRELPHRECATNSRIPHTVTPKENFDEAEGLSSEEYSGPMSPAPEDQEGPKDKVNGKSQITLGRKSPTVFDDLPSSSDESLGMSNSDAGSRIRNWDAPTSSPVLSGSKALQCKSSKNMVETFPFQKKNTETLSDMLKSRKAKSQFCSIDSGQLFGMTVSKIPSENVDSRSLLNLLPADESGHSAASGEILVAKAEVDCGDVVGGQLFDPRFTTVGASPQCGSKLVETNEVGMDGDVQNTTFISGSLSAVQVPYLTVKDDSSNQNSRVTQTVVVQSEGREQGQPVSLNIGGDASACSSAIVLPVGTVGANDVLGPTQYDERIADLSGADTEVNSESSPTGHAMTRVVLPSVVDGNKCFSKAYLQQSASTGGHLTVPTAEVITQPSGDETELTMISTIDQENKCAKDNSCTFTTNQEEEAMVLANDDIVQHNQVEHEQGSDRSCALEVTIEFEGENDAEDDDSTMLERFQSLFPVANHNVDT